ncbi:sialate O-acetylesterase [Brevundimonas vesicularis]|uniref:sialate O-acetylesterase n=1 Tax=Brevundimonas vesicularis TaxID=41276 RepID=UPI00384FA53E
MADPASVKARLLKTFRDYRVDGVPASGANEPDKGEIRASLAPVVDLAQEAKDIASLAGSTFVVAAKSELASLSPSKVGDRAEVRNDPAGDVTNGNGVYRWTGAAWVWVSDLLPASVEGAIDRAALGESGDELDTPHPVVAVEVDESGKVVLERLADGRIDLEPGPRLLAKMGALGASGINNLAADSIIASRDVIGEDRRRVWSDADTQPLWRYSIRKDAASLGTAVPAVSYATLVIWYGQSNAEGNSGGEVITTSPPSPRRALMLSTGVRGTGADASNAAGIPDLLPAREVVTAASPLLGESPATSMMASLIARDGNTVPTLYVGRVPAKGGYRVDQLASGTVPFTNMVQEVARISALLALHKITDLRVVVSYLQGETDAVSSTPAATYKATLSTLLTAIRTQLGAVANVTDVKIVLCQAATNALSSIYPNDPAAMQYEIARDDTTGKVFLGEPNYQFPLSSQPSDNYHTSAAAKVALGRKTARTYKRALAGQRTAVMPNQAGIARVGNAIIIPFETPDNLDLAIDPTQPAITGLGFEVFMGPAGARLSRPFHLSRSPALGRSHSHAQASQPPAGRFATPTTAIRWRVGSARGARWRLSLTPAATVTTPPSLSMSWAEP